MEGWKKGVPSVRRGGREEKPTLVLPRLLPPPPLLQHTHDTVTYKQLVARIGARLGPEYELDR